jgi:hypothetical protein
LAMEHFDMVYLKDAVPPTARTSFYRAWIALISVTKTAYPIFIAVGYVTAVAILVIYLIRRSVTPGAVMILTFSVAVGFRALLLAVYFSIPGDALRVWRAGVAPSIALAVAALAEAVRMRRARLPEVIVAARDAEV